jgi:hypothetical protein
MYIYMYTYIYIYIYMYIYVYICIYIHMYIYIHTHIQLLERNNEEKQEASLEEQLKFMTVELESTKNALGVSRTSLEAKEVELRMKVGLEICIA